MSKISEENIIRILSRLDVPGNAAKIYIFLLKNGPSTGYAVSKRSGVNNAVVYRELERLKNRNACIGAAYRRVCAATRWST